jgi:hypothetical protein
MLQRRIYQEGSGYVPGGFQEEAHYTMPGLVSAFEQGLVHTKESVQEFLAAKGVKTILHPPYLLDLVPKVKLELAGLSLFQEPSR